MERIDADWPSEMASQDPDGNPPPSTRTISIFGPQRSGKTSWLASLYGVGADDAAAVIRFNGTAARAYLKARWLEYQTLSFPDGTAKANPQRISFRIKELQPDPNRPTPTREWDVTLIDYAGELVHDPPAGDRDAFLRKPVDDWLSEAEAILVFVDASEAQTKDLLDRRDEVLRLLQLCQTGGPEGPISKPIGLVLTKWDTLRQRLDDAVEFRRAADFELELEPYEAECARARWYLANTPSLKRIHTLLETAAPGYEVFPMSAIGYNRVPMKYPTEPFNTVRPVVWAAEQADLGRYHRAHEECAGLSGAKAIRVYREFLARSNITLGSVYEQATRDIGRLTCRVRTTRRRIAVAVLVAATALTAAWYSQRRSAALREYYNTLLYRTSHGDAVFAETRRAQAEALLAKHRWPLGATLVSEIERWISSDRESESETAWAHINATAAEALSEQALQSVFDECEAFIRAHPESPRLPEVHKIKSCVKAYRDCMRDVNALVAKNEFEAAIARLRSLMNSGLWALSVKHEKDVANKLETVLDDHQFATLEREARDAIARNWVNFDSARLRFVEIAERIARYAAVGGRKSDRAEALRQLLLRGWDRRLYSAASARAREAARSLDKPSIRAAADAVQLYLKDDPVLSMRAMRTQVEAWNRWYDMIIGDHTYTVTLETVAASRDSWLGKHGPSYPFKVKVSGERFSEVESGTTEEKDHRTTAGGVEASFKSLPDRQRTFACRYRFGDEAEKLTVKVCRPTGSFGAWQNQPLQFKTDVFAIASLDRGTTWPMEDGSYYFVRASCREAAPPALEEKYAQ